MCIAANKSMTNGLIPRIAGITKTATNHMKPDGWNFLSWQPTCDLLEQAERIQRNYLRVVIESHCQSSYSCPGTWARALNDLETGETWWVMSALPGLEPDQIDVRLEGNQLRMRAHACRPHAARRCTDIAGDPAGTLRAPVEFNQGGLSYGWEDSF